MTHVNIHDAIDETLDALADDWSHKADVKREYSGTMDVECEPADLIAALVSVLTEASRIIRDRGVIGIRTWRDDLFVHMAISSSGKGLSQFQFPQILKLMEDTDLQSERESGGIGVLCIFLQEHHGSFSIESGVEIGTTFTFKLPVNTRSGAASAYYDLGM
jgi:two-component system NtrC family sensor kinase